AQDQTLLLQLVLLEGFFQIQEKNHWEAVKWIMRYLRGTSKLCLYYGGAKHVLRCYTDSNVMGDVDTKRSTSGYLFIFCGGAVS
ncbi:hypothetical protein, partial [Escherichia coli]|uniref:hypothetical protein n=1 Tax=Escherichia coli TaxID=562 RepID=UPI003F48D175